MTFVVPNGFSEPTRLTSRALVAARPAATAHEPVRIGYAAGSFTHQEICGWRRRPWRACASAPALPAGAVRTVHGCFGVPRAGRPRPAEIEWRRLVPLEQLPAELVRFDINLAPLQVNSPFCDAKSPLKYFEAALVDVPTIASPTGPFRDAIAHGSTGPIAEWSRISDDALTALVHDAGLRRRLALNAYVDVLGRYGRNGAAQLVGQRTASSAATRGWRPKPSSLRSGRLARRPRYRARSATTGCSRTPGDAPGEVTVVVPVHNYAVYLLQRSTRSRARRSGRSIVIVDDASTDDSGAAGRLVGPPSSNALPASRRHALHRRTPGLAAARNSAFSSSRTPYSCRSMPTTCCSPTVATSCWPPSIEPGRFAHRDPPVRRFDSARRAQSPPSPPTAGGRNTLMPWPSSGSRRGPRLAGTQPACADGRTTICGALAERGMFGVHVDTELALYGCMAAQ